MTSAGVTAEIIRRARALRFDALPADVVFIAKQCLLDWLGVTIAGAAEPATSILRAEILADGGTPRASLIGTGERTGPIQAALVNGTASHALDFDDVAPAMSGHPSAAVIAALLALAEGAGLDGARFVTSFVAGVETECRVAKLVAPGHYGAGWHATGTIGTFGAAAASAMALGLTAEQWAHAFGLAATQAAGLKAVFGTMAKPLHAGKAATNGLLAARLAARGFTSEPAILEAANGFAATMTTTVDVARATAHGADDFELRNVLFKYHAACYAAHASLEGVLRLVEANSLGPDDVARVELRVPAPVYTACANRSPLTPLEAKFSLNYVTALALAGFGTGGPAFTSENLVDPAVMALSERVVAVLAPDITEKFAAEVVLTTTSARELRISVDVSTPVSGAEALRVQWTRLVAKFQSLAEPVIGTGQATQLIEAVESLEALPSLLDLLRLAAPTH